MTATYVDYKALESDVQTLVEAGHPDLSTNALANLLDLATDGNTPEARLHWTRYLVAFGVAAPVREDYVRAYEVATPDSERPEPSFTMTATDTTPETPEDDESDTDSE